MSTVPADFHGDESVLLARRTDEAIQAFRSGATDAYRTCTTLLERVSGDLALAYGRPAGAAPEQVRLRVLEECRGRLRRALYRRTMP